MPNDTNGSFDVFVHDRATKKTTRASIGQGEVQGNSYSGSDGPTISADGRFIAFDSSASNFIVGDTNNDQDVFVRDRWLVPNLTQADQKIRAVGRNSAAYSAAWSKPRTFGVMPVGYCALRPCFFSFSQSGRFQKESRGDIRFVLDSG